MSTAKVSISAYPELGSMFMQHALQGVVETFYHNRLWCAYFLHMRWDNKLVPISEIFCRSFAMRNEFQSGVRKTRGT